MRNRFKLARAAIVFMFECCRYGLPGLPQRIRKARHAAARRHVLINPGDWSGAADAARAAGDRVFIEEFLPRVEARAAKKRV